LQNESNEIVASDLKLAKYIASTIYSPTGGVARKLIWVFYKMGHKRLL